MKNTGMVRIVGISVSDYCFGTSLPGLCSKKGQTGKTIVVMKCCIGWLVGCVAPLVERRSLTGKLSCPALDLQLTGDHLSYHISYHK